MNRIRFLIPVVLFSSIAATPAFADSSRTVSFADLDLSSPAGVATLDSRINSAIRRVCGDPFPKSLTSRDEIARCRRETLASIQDQRSNALASAQNRSEQYSSR